eukprot:Em0021g989a
MSAALSHQSWLYIDTADQLVHLSRVSLVQACMPYCSLAMALDVLSTGTYPRLPLAIKEKVILPSSLTQDEQVTAFRMLEGVIRRRLLKEGIPEPMMTQRIRNGMVTFVVPYEFEVSMSLMSDDPIMFPWRLVELKILVANSLLDKPLLLHSNQLLYVHQLVQSRLFVDDNPLTNMYLCLHYFCLSLQLDCLWSQAVQLWGSNIKIEEYLCGQRLKISYWCITGSQQALNAGSLTQQGKAVLATTSFVTITIDPGCRSNPFIITHSPPLASECRLSLSSKSLSLECLLAKCITLHSEMLLRELMSVLKATSWKNKAVFEEASRCLKILVPLGHTNWTLLIGIDNRTGHVIASLEVDCLCASVKSALEMVEREVTDNKSCLPAQLTLLQCQLFLASIEEKARAQGLRVRPLPLLKPLPFPSDTKTLFVELQPLAYLVVTASPHPQFTDTYYILQVAATGDDVAIPQCFFVATSLEEIEPKEAVFSHMRAITVSRSGYVLKRKLEERGLETDLVKRVCLQSAFSPSPFTSLLCSQLNIHRLLTSLNIAGIHCHVLQLEYGSTCVQIHSLPQLETEANQLHDLLSQHLESCMLVPTTQGVECRMVFKRPLTRSDGQVVKRILISNSCEGVGIALLALWRAMISLLGIALELEHYMSDVSWSYRSDCHSVRFDLTELSLLCNQHEISLGIDIPSGEFKIDLNASSHFFQLRDALRKVIISTKSLPLLIQGMIQTDQAVQLLSQFVQSMTSAKLTADSPSHIHLHYDVFCLSVVLISNGGVQFVDFACKSGNVGLMQSNAQRYFQDFVKAIIYGSEIMDQEDATVTPTPVAKPVLLPSPSPIVSPRPSPWPASPLPSIPPLPSPVVEGKSLTSHRCWAITVSMQQMADIFSVSGSGPRVSRMEAFFGSLSLLFASYNLVQLSSQQPPQQQQFQWQFISLDHGVHLYHTEALAVTLSLDVTKHIPLKVTFKPLTPQEGVWSELELQTLEEFFYAEVACRPFLHNSMHSFMRILSVPLATLKSAINVMQLHLRPPNDSIWRLHLCLVVPSTRELKQHISHLPPGDPGVINKIKLQKLLFFIRIVRKEDGVDEDFPLLHDYKANTLVVAAARERNTAPTALQQAIDTAFKRATELPSSHPETSLLYPAIRSLLYTQLPV